MRVRIFIISGAPGSGKTTTARALCAHYSRAAHISVDDVRHLVVSGFVSLRDDWTSETKRQLALARRAAGVIATTYADAGFVVVIDDVVEEAELAEFGADLGGRDLAKVLLTPRLDVALLRAQTRTTKLFDPTTLSPSTARLHSSLLEGCRPEDQWILLDSSELSPDDIARAIERRSRSRQGD